MNWKSMSTLLAGIPDLPGARCKARADLFESTIAAHDKTASRAEIQNARTAALHICHECPALAPCRVWLDGLRPMRRPRGVVAGQVIASGGLPLSTKTTASARPAQTDDRGDHGDPDDHDGSHGPSDHRDEAGYDR